MTIQVLSTGRVGLLGGNRRHMTCSFRLAIRELPVWRSAPYGDSSGVCQRREGSIQARSAGEGRGSRFTIRLARGALPRADHPGGAAKETVLSPRRIVIVEDDEDARQMFKALLELASHEVHDAADGPAGIELVAAVEPDIAFVDIGLPGVDGYEVARRLRERHKDLCLVAMSGYGQSEDRRKAVEAGFDIHLLKPVDPDRLSAIIAALSLFLLAG